MGFDATAAGERGRERLGRRLAAASCERWRESKVEGSKEMGWKVPVTRLAACGACGGGEEGGEEEVEEAAAAGA